MIYLLTTDRQTVINHGEEKVIVSLLSHKETPPKALTVPLMFTCISYVVDSRKMTLYCLTLWQRRLTSAKCQNDVGMAP